MNDQSFSISAKAASELIALVRDGAMTEETFMELRHLRINRSSLSAKTTSDSTSADGSQNSAQKLVTQEEWLGYSSTRSEEPPTQQSSTPLSHSGCWCSYSKKRGTSNG